jgi:hypothetical protein
VTGERVYAPSGLTVHAGATVPFETTSLAPGVVPRKKSAGIGAARHGDEKDGRRMGRNRGRRRRKAGRKGRGQTGARSAREGGRGIWNSLASPIATTTKTPLNTFFPLPREEVNASMECPRRCRERERG